MLTPFFTRKFLALKKFGYLAGNIQKTDYRTIGENGFHGCSLG
jgi:hypothetical protein